MPAEFNVNEYAEVNAAPVTAVPITMFGWIYKRSSARQDIICGVFDASQAQESFSIDCTGDNARMITYSGAIDICNGGENLKYQWNSVCGVWPDASNRHLYLNGRNVANTTGSHIPTGIDRTSVGRFGDSTPQADTDAYTAHVAIWNAALNQPEIQMLNRGVSPLLVRPQNIVAYYPLDKDYDNYAPNTVGSYNLTNNNGTIVNRWSPVTSRYNDLLIGSTTSTAGEVPGPGGGGLPKINGITSYTSLNGVSSFTSINGVT